MSTIKGRFKAFASAFLLSPILLLSKYWFIIITQLTAYLLFFVVAVE